MDIQKPLRVSELVFYIKNLLRDDLLLSNIYVEGEVSGIYNHMGGHTFFNLKDDKAKVSCVVFANSNTYPIKEGEKVRVYGKIDLYEKEGRFQVVVSKILPVGIAESYEKFLLQKLKFEKLGYFAEERKREVKNVKSVGLITSSKGAAIQDFLTILRHKNPFVGVEIFPVFVQGVYALSSITRAIKYFQNKSVDVIVITRGGGSKEDLSVFNEEKLVKSVFNSKIPVLSALGHSIDMTFCDMCADRYAITPTEAASIVAGDFELKISLLRSAPFVLNKILSQKLNSLGNLIKTTDENRLLLTLKNAISSKEVSLEQLKNRLEFVFERFLTEKKVILEKKLLKIESLNPSQNFKKGYAVVQKNKKWIKTSSELTKGDRVRLYFLDGYKEVEVI